MNSEQPHRLLVLSGQKKFKIWATILNYHKETMVHAFQRFVDLYQVKV